MKKLFYLVAVFFHTALSVSAQKTKTIPAGEITTNTTWYNDTIYTLGGYVYVKGATLTIQPGTIIRGGDPANKATLIITRTGKLEARGTASQPIVFTSGKAEGLRAPGDWGGLVILGQAVINRPTDCSTCPGTAVAATIPGVQNAIEGDLDNAAGDGLYGGTDNNHSSGTITYVRIEFGGVVITPGNEINGLTMGGVGKGTTIHHIQVTQANDDGFEWFGGNVDAKYLVSYRNIDDDLDVDFGYSGNVQYAIVMRDSAWYDIGSGPTTNGVESDNDGTGTEATPYTNPTFSNVTLVGPLANGTPLSAPTSFQNGLRIRRNSSTSFFNSIVMGWPAGIFVDGTRTGQKFANDSMLFNNNIMAGNLVHVNASSAGTAPVVLAKIVANGTDTFASAGGLLNNPFNYLQPDFTAVANSAATSGASFTSATRISNPFFTATTFRGAMGSNPDSNWTNCWCRFNPQNENYNSAPINYPVPLAGFTSDNPSGRKVIFTNNSSFATTYHWDFGVTTATNDTSVLMNPSFIYPANGTYTVTLIAKSVCGTSVHTATVVINDQSTNPVANFNFVQSTTTTGSNEFTFTNTTDEKGFSTTYMWDFGVSNTTDDTSTAKNPVFTFPASGVYDVKLIARSQFGSDSITQTVTAFRVSIPEVITSINNINVFPNPANDIVNINFTMVQSEEVTVTINDISGKVVKSVPAEVYNSGLKNIIVDVSDLNSGLYFVSVRSANYNKTTRMIITK